MILMFQKSPFPIDSSADWAGLFSRFHSEGSGKSFESRPSLDIVWLFSPFLISCIPAEKGFVLFAAE